MKNLFRDAQGKPLTHWTAEASAWDLCFKEVLKNSVYFNNQPWNDQDIIYAVKRLWKGRKGWLSFTEE